MGQAAQIFDEEFFPRRWRGQSGGSERRQIRAIRPVCQLLARPVFPLRPTGVTALRTSFSDLRFHRCQIACIFLPASCGDHCNQCAVVTRVDGLAFADLDGHWTLDVGGIVRESTWPASRAYKEWMARGLERVQDHGPVLGPLHPSWPRTRRCSNRCRASTKSPFT